MATATLPLSSSPLLTREQAAQYLGLSVQTLCNWACTGRGGLPYVRVSARAIRYRQTDLDAWLAARTMTHTGDPLPAAATA